MYHALLLFAAIVAAGIYILLTGLTIGSFIFILALPLVLVNLFKVRRTSAAEDLDPYLKQLAIATFVFTIFFGLAIIF